MDQFWQDVRFALRSLKKTPGFTALAVLTLALGLGANTAIFSVVRSVVLKPLPYEEPREIVRVWPERHFSKEMLAAFEERAGSFATFSGYRAQTFSWTGQGDPEELLGTLVATDHFAVLGVEAALGRAFEPGDRGPGAERVVVLSHALWERRFGADPDVLGRTVSLGEGTLTIVGVLPADFRPLSGPGSELWVPLIYDTANLDDYRDMIAYRALARLEPGISQAQAEAETRAVAQSLMEELPAYYDPQQVASASVVPLHEVMIGGVETSLWVLFGAVGLVLLMGCSNVANMLLARSGAREREIAVRAALGAGRRRLVRQLLTESLLLGVAGGGVGFLAAVWMESALVARLPASVPRAGEIGAGLPELVFTAGLSLFAALVFGLLPALRSTRPERQGALREGIGRTVGGHRYRANRMLVTAEIALAILLTAAAGLMLRSLWRLEQVDPGFTPEKLLTLRLSPPVERYGDAARLTAYYADVRERVEALPGVISASAITLLPLTNSVYGVGYSTKDHPVTPGMRPSMTSLRGVVPGYFQTMGIPLVSGRDFTEADSTGTREVGLLNETLARELWPTENAVGREILWDDGSPWFTVIGVVGDVRQTRLDREPRTEVYRPLAQATAELGSTAMYLTVRLERDAAGVIGPLREAVWSLGRDVPISRVAAMDQIVGSSMARRRFLTALLATFGVLALILGAVGVYGVGSFVTSQRTREIGVRMALGAARAAMLRSVMAREMRPVVVGIVAGLLGALGATRVLESSLFGVSSTDPATFAVVALFLLVVALLASYLPARRAAGIDPIVALRSE